MGFATQPIRSALTAAAAVAGMTAAGDTIGFNAGESSSLVASDGIEYRGETGWRTGADGGFVGGEAVADVSRTFFVDGEEGDGPLYGVFREGSHLWRFSVEPGPFELTMRFNETEADGPGIRRMVVSVDRDTLLDDLDIHALVGKERALNIRREVFADVDSIEISFAAHEASLLPPRVSAIALRSLSAGVPPPLEAPIDLEVYPGDDDVLFTWRPAGPVGLDRYEVWTSRRGRFFSPSLESVSSTIRYLPWIRLPADPGLSYRVRALDAGGYPGDVARVGGSAPRDPGPLSRWELWIDEDDLRSMERALPAKIDRSAMLVIDALARFGDLQFRGTGSLRQPKKSWKMRIEGGEPVRGSAVVNMTANFNDAALLREPLAHRLMRDCGIDAYRVDPLSLSLNGTLLGVFEHVEEPDAVFLARIGLDPNGRSYKVEAGLFPLVDESAYIESFQNTQTEDWIRRDVVDLVQNLDRLQGPDLEIWLRATFDIDTVIDWYALQVFLGNNDFAMRNQILHRDRLGGKWRVLPWDVEGLLYEHGTPADFTTAAAPDARGEYNALADRLLEPRSLRRRYLRRLEMLLDGPLATERTAAVLDSLADLIVEDGFLDTEKMVRESAELYRWQTEEMRQILAGRETTLRASVASLMPNRWVDLALNEIARPGSTIVELHHRGAEPLDLEGVYLSDDPDDLYRWPVPATVLSEGERATVGLPGRQEGWLFLVAPENVGVIDEVHLGAYSPQAVVGRYPDGAGRMRVLRAPTPGGENLWDPTVAMEVSVDDRYVAPGETIELSLTVRATWRQEINTMLRIEATGAGGVWLPVPFVIDVELGSLRRGERIEKEIDIPIPSDAWWIGGGRYDLILSAFERDDRVARESVSIYVDTGSPETLVINELCASNATVVSDEMGEYDDWVEIFNPTTGPLSTAGLYLSDDWGGEPLRWTLPVRTLAPGEVLLLWLDGDTEQGELHGPFRLARGGEEVALIRGPESDPLVVDRIVFGYQETDWSLARVPAGQPTWEPSGEPTPGGR
ncbi:MAG: hypothetical protein CME06_17320 [Gemmatimonadetes bacterium]|nr:hypothetical protein [Gemmatimonadota bacterium]